MFVVKDHYNRVQLHGECPVRDKDGWHSGTFIGYLPTDMFTDMSPDDEPAEVMLISVPETAERIRIPGKNPMFKVGDRIREWSSEYENYDEYGKIVKVTYNDEYGMPVYIFENGDILFEADLDEAEAY